MKVKVYSHGLVHCSACAEKDLTPEQVEAEVNKLNPSGVQPWKISEENFADGGPNPGPCEQNEGRKHYLMVC